ncbi:MAG: hypothetical protein WC516_01390 [Patescibacteria group bacterium]
MLVTSKDILWISLSIIILWIGICLGFGALYLALMLRDFRKITGGFKKKLDFIDQILSTLKKRAEGTATYLPPLIQAGEKIVEAFREKKKSDAEKAKKKKK